MKKRSVDVLQLIACVIVLLSMVLVVRFKQDYYMDELLSFSLSNNETGWIRIIDGNIYNPEQLYHDELMPAPEHRFDYEMVWHNQTTDVHPPLYYALLHTACSMMPNKVSKWMPAAINFLFALMTLYVMHRLFCVFVETEAAQKGYRRYAGIASLLFTVLPGTLNNVSFFRMYVMAMLLVAVIAYISVIVVRTGYIQIGGDRRPPWLALLVAEILSSLTHYYIVMYLVFAIGVLILILLFNKRWKDAMLAIVTSVIAAGVSIAIFPTMLEHIFNGYRGEQSAENLQQMTVSRYASQIAAFLNGVSKELWGGLLLVLLVVSMVLILYRMCKRRNTVTADGDVQNTSFHAAAMLSVMIIPCVCYFLLLSAIAVEVTTRYMYPIYAVLYTGVMVLVWKGLQSLGRYWYAILAGILVVMTVLSYWKADWRYLYRNDPLREQLAEHSGSQAVVIYDAEWKCVELFRQLQDVSQVCFITSDEFDLLMENELANADELLVFVTNREYADELQEYLRKDVEELGTHSDFVVYEFYNET